MLVGIWRKNSLFAGSGTYLECSGCSIANHQSPSEMEMLLYWRKKSCQSIQPLRHCAQGGCRRRRFFLTEVSVRAVQIHTLKIPGISWNDLQRPEPRIHFCPQPSTMILGTCRISSMYSSSAEATYEPACIQREKLHTVKMEIPTGPSPSSGTSWGMGETHTEGELQNHLHNSSGTPACNILKRAWSML